VARRATGQVLEYDLRQGRTYALRFHAYGARQHITLGSAADGWSRPRADAELQNVLADGRRGIWVPAREEPAPAPATDPIFHEFASMWLAGRERELAMATLAGYRWQLTHHLLPFFHAHHLSQITIAEVDRYRAAKVKAGGLSPTSINMTITRLAQILDVGLEHHPAVMNGNPARGRRRRVKQRAPARSFLEAEQVNALLQAAGELDAEARDDRKGVGRRALLATLALAGLRVGELVALRWADVDLAAGRLHIRDAKTAAGIREVEISGLLRDELATHKGRYAVARPQDYVFGTGRGQPTNASNIRNRLLARAIARANERLVARGAPPIPPGITPHSLRRTYISLLLQAGENPRVVMAQVGHSDPGITLRIYAQVMQRREHHAAERLDGLIGDIHWAEKGRNPEKPPADTPSRVRRNTQKPRRTRRNTRWAIQDSNLGPLPYQRSALTD